MAFPDEGDVVMTPLGIGVIASEMRENFEFPIDEEAQGDKKVATIEASEGNEAYVVGLLNPPGGAPFRREQLRKTEFSRNVQPERPDGTTINGLDAIVEVETEGLPSGWSRQSLLNWWASVGGTFDDCVDALSGESSISEGQPQGQCGDWKDMIVGTERWRSRF